MAWIHSIEPDDAEGPLEDLYDAIGKARSGVADVHRAQSLNPRALRAHIELYKAVVFARSSLGRVQRERIAVVVSQRNECAYCVAHHGESLGQLGEDPDVRASLERGEIPPHLSEADRELLAWAQRTTERPAASSRADCQRLLSLGWDDRAVLDATLTIAYFNFVNRIVLLLGVDLEGDFERFCGDDGDLA